MGIGGVWSWLTNGRPIADLKLVGWDSRECTIIPDSDVFQRIDLMRAIYALGRELRGLGANVYLCELPHGESTKTGLDDFLLAGGNIDLLETFRLDHRRFKSIEFWYRDWKLKKALKLAA